jgi:hypothetical protein
MSPSLHKAANGYLTLNFNDAPETCWRTVLNRLETGFDFVREGQMLCGVDEAIFPNFVSSSCTIEAGYDNWSGIYLLSQSAEGDAILQKLFSDVHA